MTQPSTVSVPDHVPAELVVRFDFRNDDDIRDNLWDYIASMKDRPDIFFSPDLGGYWVITRASLIEKAFSDHELFSARSVAVPKLENPVRLIPNNYDPPEHTPYRRVFTQNLFSPRALSGLEDVTRAHAHTLFSKFEPGRCEFIANFAQQLPIDVFLAGMGVDPSHRSDFIPWVNDVFCGRNVEETQRGMSNAATFLASWLQEQLAAPEANTGTMFHGMINAQVEGRKLSFDEMHRITVMLFLGGLDTVTAQLSHIMRFMALSPSHRELLVQQPGEIPRAIEEMLRRFGIANIGRVVAKDVELAGVKLKAGDPVLVSTPIAGLDEQAYENPLEVNFERGRARGVRHLGFGAGPHLCPGAYLARTQLRVVLEELLPLMPGLRIAPGTKSEWRTGATFAVKELHLEWDRS